MVSNVINFDFAKKRYIGKSSSKHALRTDTQVQVCIAEPQDTFIDWVLKLLNKISRRLTQKPLLVKRVAEPHYYQAVILSGYQSHYKVSMEELDSIQVVLSNHYTVCNNTWEQG